MTAQRAGTLRLFVALYPPQDVARAMLAAGADAEREAVGSGAPWPRARWTVPEQLHITLHFIGDRREKELPEIEVSVERSAAGLGPFWIQPARLRTLPENKAARLVAIEADAPPQLLELHRRLVSRLATSPRASDGFTPHITLCRFQGEPRRLRLDRPVAVDRFEVAEIALMRSVLGPAAAEHRVLRRVAL